MRHCLSAFIILALIISCAPREKTYRKSSAIMDTIVTITVVADSKEGAEGAIDAGFGEIRRIEKLLSFWTEDSEIAAIYHNAGMRVVKVSAETREVIERSIDVSQKTGGAFDPTVGPLMRLWDFHEKKMPTEEEIKNNIGLVDYKQMEIDRENSTAFLKVKGMSFDTGGIVKGYAVDRAVDVLKAEGIESGLVAIAGDIRGFGPRTWKIGIRDPRPEDPEDNVMATVTLKDRAISTSGDYERSFTQDGVFYHHILNPKTGLPARGTWSVSVIADEAVLTDGFSTGVFVIGPEKGLGLLGELGMEGVIVAEGGKVTITPGLEGVVEFKK
jgi:thiamine biosynthesis lipoprotein